MKVLHVYPKSDALIRQHVTLLADGMRQSADVQVADSTSSFRQYLHEMEPDVVHCHGCWHYYLARAAASARNNGARVVVTLHGQLEPWVIKQQSIQENVSKTLLWQKKTIEKAYSIITLGKLERGNFEKLGWNRRVEEIHNAVITNAITPEEMCTRTYAVYQKVLDSYTHEQLNDDSLTALSIILKAGITGDKRWTSLHDLNYNNKEIDWRRLLIYAEHENIRNYVDYGINILGLTTPVIDTSKIISYFPDGYQRPKPLKEIIGDYQGDETDFLLRMIRQIGRQPLLLHLVELTRELYRDNVNDDQLNEQLEDKKLTNFTARLMQVLREQTLLDDGFMPLAPIDDKQTQQIRKHLTNHLKI